MDEMVFRADQQKLADVALFFQDPKPDRSLFEEFGMFHHALNLAQLVRPLTELINREAPQTDLIHQVARELGLSIMVAEFMGLKGVTDQLTIGSELHFEPEAFLIDDDDPGFPRPFNSFMTKLVRKKSGWFMYDIRPTKVEGHCHQIFDHYIAKELADEDEMSIEDLAVRYSGNLNC